MSLILDAAARPGLTVTRQRLSAVNASVTVGSASMPSWFPTTDWPGQEPFDPAESLRPDRMRVNGSLALGLAGGAPGCWDPGRSTTR